MSILCCSTPRHAGRSVLNGDGGELERDRKPRLNRLRYLRRQLPQILPNLISKTVQEWLVNVQLLCQTFDQRLEGGALPLHWRTRSVTSIFSSSAQIDKRPGLLVASCPDVRGESIRWLVLIRHPNGPTRALLE